MIEVFKLIYLSYISVIIADIKSEIKIRSNNSIRNVFYIFERV